MFSRKTPRPAAVIVRRQAPRRDVRTELADTLARDDTSPGLSLPRLSLPPRAQPGASDAASEPALRSDVRTWPDAWLVAAVACEPPDVAALDALVARYWKTLYGRCEMLVQDRERASDLAQEAWARVLRARRSLQPHENFAGFLVTVATNIWRDWNRTARRAGALAEHRLASLDSALPMGDGDGVVLGELLPDLHSLSSEDHAVLKMDVDRALARLAPRLRDVLIARYVEGESAAEIGARYGRTEQTITTWLRKAIGELRVFLEDTPSHTASPRSAP